MQDLALEKAVDLLLAHCHRVTAVEEVPLLSALGRILAEDYVAEFDNPPEFVTPEEKEKKLQKLLSKFSNRSEEAKDNNARLVKTPK